MREEGRNVSPVMICAHLKNEFKLTYGKFGPTELRVLMILLNTIWFSIEPLHTFSLPVKVGPLAGELLSLDLAGVVVFAILCFTYFGSLIKDGKYFAKVDPLVKKNK